MRGSKERGVSLAETVLTMFLVGIFLVIAADLASKLSHVQEFSGAKSVSLEILNTTLTSLRTEVLAATEVQSPSSTATVPTVVLRRVKQADLAPSATGRLLDSDPAISFVFLPIDDAHTVEVTYDVQGGHLRRDSDSPIDLVEAKSLEASRRADGAYEIRLSLDQIGEKARTFKIVVHRW